MADVETQREGCAACAAHENTGEMALRGPLVINGHAVDRRAFLSAATLASVAALLSACSNALGPGGGFGSPAGWGGALAVKLSDYPSLAQIGGMARVDGGNGSPTALVRTGTSAFAGISMICTHQGATVDITGNGFFCPNHGAQYSKSGSWVGGQPTSGLYTFPTSYSATAGTITVSRPS